MPPLENKSQNIDQIPSSSQEVPLGGSPEAGIEKKISPESQVGTSEAALDLGSESDFLNKRNIDLTERKTTPNNQEITPALTDQAVEDVLKGPEKDFEEIEGIVGNDPFAAKEAFSKKQAKVISSLYPGESVSSE